MCWRMQNLLTKNVLGLGTHVLNYTKMKVGDTDPECDSWTVFALNPDRVRVSDSQAINALTIYMSNSITQHFGAEK